ncbi:class I SAM-dependent methyltransferase [Halotalea alkalilenta]|uniref:class I SAM-dependent methyltransferase n=1 Tax=Halotalea alkalilenta TaxID=376489 RepID=UPI0004862AFE|nr:class I SAM-dependent methyltransferase [Halotalea alkalilenta]
MMEYPDGWERYYRLNERREGSPLLRRALAMIAPDQRQSAVDLGCGAGLESGLLLERGWSVHAVDKQRSAIDRVEAIAQRLPQGRLTTVTSHFESLGPLPSSSLVFAGMSLPFCHPDGFPRLWALITRALVPGGLFVGNLLGDRDGWSSIPTMTFHSLAQAEASLLEFEVLSFAEIEEDGSSMRGPKRWHRFDIIARRR